MTKPSPSGTLNVGEVHPSSYAAMKWIRTIPAPELMQWMEAFASDAIEGNRLSEICGETLHRILQGEPVSDRYVLGLAWAMRYTG